MKRDLNNLKLIVAETLCDNLSRVCFAEVDNIIIENIANAIYTNDSVWMVANDSLSNCAIQELEDSNTFEYFNSLK